MNSSSLGIKLFYITINQQKYDQINTNRDIGLKQTKQVLKKFLSLLYVEMNTIELIHYQSRMDQNMKSYYEYTLNKRGFHDTLNKATM